MSIKNAHELRKKLVELAADGWEPAPSGNGCYLYMHKEGSYNPPGIYAPMMCGACDLIDHRFFEDLEFYKLHGFHGYE